MNKSELRKQAMTERRLIDPSAIKRLNEQLLQRFSKLDFSAISVLHIFLPIAEKAEPDTFQCINWLKNHHPHIKILVPKADFRTALMTHHEWRGMDYLEKSTFNILEPRSEEVYKGLIDLVVVPLLAFDKCGYRVGYGKGFYDRFLEGSDALKVGLSFFEAVDEISDVDALDVRLDLCITPDKIYYFNT
ncbi:5-formyltetrahydrofolate cyclo-ligase [Pedobacter duraquae]|uniref:5-formyltetrahydrofolate cyclo-ligase n=1 Tax=Pedobacter duraquae TaxID=425511 RepID=A0A4R6ICB5_9SPHI|nr:5-formyltetrahydrofolate cyclo-ligase [Pedobacter duraquae]TDO19207.1 5-formyltetrahydrofolate cyclo-ligase [Pedobacter duraquae]